MPCAVGHGGRLQDEPASDPAEVGHLKDEARLADAWLAAKSDDVRLARFYPSHQCLQCLDIRCAAHEGAQRSSPDLESRPFPSHRRARPAGPFPKGSVAKCRSTKPAAWASTTTSTWPGVLEECVDGVRGPTPGVPIHPCDGPGPGNQVRTQVDRETAVFLPSALRERLQHRVRRQDRPARRVVHGLDPENRHQLGWRELLYPAPKLVIISINSVIARRWPTCSSGWSALSRRGRRPAVPPIGWCSPDRC